MNIDLFAHFDIYQDHGHSPNQNPNMTASLTQVDLSSLDSKLQGEYEARLRAEVRILVIIIHSKFILCHIAHPNKLIEKTYKDNSQVRNLRKMYEEQMRVAQEEWLKLHQSKVSIAIMTMMKITTTPKAVTDHNHNYVSNKVNTIINCAKQQLIIVTS